MTKQPRPNKFIATVLVVVSLITFSTAAALAQGPINPPPGGGIIKNPLPSTTDIPTLIEKVILFILSLAAPLALAAFIWAGFLYITAFANEDNVEKAKKIAMWAAIGLVMMGAAFIMISIIRKILLTP